MSTSQAVHDGETLLVLFPPKWLVTKQVVGVAHLDDAKLSFDVVCIAVHDQMHHGVGEVIFDAIFTELLVIVTRHFTDEEGGQAQPSNGLEQAEDFVTGVLHFGQGEEGAKRVKDEDFKPDGVPVTGELRDELAHPIHTVAHALLVELNTKVGKVDDGDPVAHSGVFDVHAHVGHVGAQGILSLLEGHVDARGLSVQHGVVEHGKGQAGFHGTAGTRHDGNVTVWDATLDVLIEAFDVGGNALDAHGLTAHAWT